jgi:plastocyanin
MKRSLIVPALVMSGLLAAATPSSAQANLVVSVARAAENSYGPTPVVIVSSAPVYYVNLDPTLAAHNVESTLRVSCPGRANGCPAFESDTVSIAQGPVPVEFNTTLPPGTYEFFCKPHGYNSMRGALQIVA